MCIIVHHPVGAKLPNTDTLLNCWLSNQDGAGIMYRTKKGIRIIKGLMTWKDFEEAYDDLKFTEYQEFALHFRIGTSGGNIPANCHPFPVTPIIKELQMLNCEANSALMHNGVLGKGDEKRKLSDTMLFVMRNLSNSFIMDNISNEVILEYLEMKTHGSRLLIFAPDHTIHTGVWHTFGGCTYSNRSFESWGKEFIGIDDYPADFDIVCPECGSDNIDFVDFEDDNYSEVYQCLSCYTLMDVDGWRYFGDEKGVNKIVKQPATKVRRKKKKKKGGFTDGICDLYKSK